MSFAVRVSRTIEVPSPPKLPARGRLRDDLAAALTHGAVELKGRGHGSSALAWEVIGDLTTDAVLIVADPKGRSRGVENTQRRATWSTRRASTVLAWNLIVEAPPEGFAMRWQGDGPRPGRHASSRIVSTEYDGVELMFVCGPIEVAG